MDFLGTWTYWENLAPFIFLNAFKHFVTLSKTFSKHKRVNKHFWENWALGEGRGKGNGDKGEATKNEFTPQHTGHIGKECRRLTPNPARPLNSRKGSGCSGLVGTLTLARFRTPH